jgi:hypothetical protein
LRQRLLQLSVERCLGAWIQFHQDFVRCCSRRCLLGSEMRCAKANQVRLVSAFDGVDSVIYRGVHDRKAARGMDGSRLRAGGADNHQKCSIPLHYLAHWFRRFGHYRRKIGGGQRGNSRAGKQ